MYPSYSLGAEHDRWVSVLIQNRRVVRKRLKPEQSVREMLRACRERAGLTQQELAAKLHIDRSTVAKIETGIIKDPGFTLVKQWCDATNSMDLMHLEFTGAGRDGWKKLLSLEALVRNMKSITESIHLRRKVSRNAVNAKLGRLRRRV